MADLTEFVRERSTSLYHVRIDGRMFHAPVSANRHPGREIVHPFLDHSGCHVMRMQPLSDEHYLSSDLPQLCAHILEKKATRVHETIFIHLFSENARMCFFTMITWYLVDDDADLAAFYRKRLSINFTILDVAVWAVVLAFRNLHVLRTYMSNDSVSTYMDCFDELVDLLKRHGCIVHSSYTPID